MIRAATFSADRSKRFDLTRDWRDEGGPDKLVVFGMLNPSKAGEKEDDPTVRKIVGFAKRWGYGRVVAVNLTAQVSTDPSGLDPWNGIDIENRAIVQRWLGEADLVVAAWGQIPPRLARRISAEALIYLFRMCCPVDLYCIGKTKLGMPRHPSRTEYTDAPELWRKREE